MRYYTRRRDIPPLKLGQRIDFRKGKGYFVVPAPKPPKPLPVAPGIPPSLFSGKGMFTTSDADCAANHPCDWLAVQMDPEGDEDFTRLPHGATLCYWQARPTNDVIAVANHRLVPYIAQAETMHELEAAIGTAYRDPNGSTGIHVTAEKALVGNCSAWTRTHVLSDGTVVKGGFEEALDQGWNLILEWYWNEQPNYSQPNACGYPLFRNVVFGTYPAENAAHRGNRVAVYQYRQVWKGPFSCWPGEGMTDQDWSSFDAA